MDRCLICSLKNNYPICKKCTVSSFEVEKCRQILAQIGDFKTLKEMYGSSIVEIESSNTPSFWNKKLDKILYLKDQDGMTRERVRIAFGFVPKNTKRILDVGAGYGFVEEFLSTNENVEIFGNDISDKAIDNLKKRFKGNFRVESIYKMSYPKSFFDVALMLEILEHIPPSKTFNILGKVRKFLKRDGTVIISVPTNEGLDKMSNNPNRHVRMYTTNLIKAELEISGFEVIQLKSIYAFKNFYKLKKILTIFLPKRWLPNDIIVLAKSL